MFNPGIWPEQSLCGSLGELVQDYELLPRTEDTELVSEDEGEEGEDEEGEDDSD